MTNQIQMIEGFLHAYLLDGKGGGRSLTWLEVAEWRASNDKSALWLHLDYTDSAVQEWVTQQSGLDPIISQALLTEETRPRVTAVEDGLLMALRGVNLNPDSDPEDMVSIRIWADKNWVVSTRKRKLLSTQDILTKLQRGLGPKNTADLIVQLADGIVWRMSDTVELLEDKMDGLEDRSLTEDHSNVRFELATLRRQAISLRRYLSDRKSVV